MKTVEWIGRRMALGLTILGVYGLWVGWFRLPDDLPARLWWTSLAWSGGILAGMGLVFTATAATFALLIGHPLPARLRPVTAAAIETALLIPPITWLILNELLYAKTSEVLGPETMLYLWHNPAAVLEAGWEMGGRYLLLATILAFIALLIIFRLSIRSYRWMYSSFDSNAAASKEPPARHQQPTIAPNRRGGFRLAGSMTLYLTIMIALLTWQFYSVPSKALTLVSRTAPPLKAMNLTRALVGVELTGPVPDAFGTPLISDEAYQATMKPATDQAPNVIMIILESVSAKALHCYGYPKSDITPNMDALAADGTLFEHCLAGGPFSSYGLVSIMTSLYLLRDEYNDHFADTSFPFMSITRALKLAGYELCLFSSGNESFDNINRFYPPEEFDTYFSHDTSDFAKADCMRMDDHYAVKKFEQWLQQRQDSRPFYGGFYLQSTHFNYEVPEPWFSHYQPLPPPYSNGDAILHIPPEILPLLHNQYDNALRYADYWVGRIRKALENAGVFDDTVVIITADHGEAFMQHGLARHGIHVWEEMIHIPLIIRTGSKTREAFKLKPPAQVADTVSGIDIAPTIAALAGLEPHPSWQGTNVLAPGYTDRDRPIFSVLQLTRWQEAVCINKLKFVHDLTEVSSLFFDLNADSDERRNLVEEKSELADALQAILGAWHTRQLAYYSPAHRPFTHYLSAFHPSDQDLARLHDQVPSLALPAATTASIGSNASAEKASKAKR